MTRRRRGVRLGGPQDLLDIDWVEEEELWVMTSRSSAQWAQRWLEVTEVYTFDGSVTMQERRDGVLGKASGFITPFEGGVEVTLVWQGPGAARRVERYTPFNSALTPPRRRRALLEPRSSRVRAPRAQCTTRWSGTCT